MNFTFCHIGYPCYNNSLPFNFFNKSPFNIFGQA